MISANFSDFDHPLPLLSLSHSRNLPYFRLLLGDPLKCGRHKWKPPSLVVPSVPLPPRPQMISIIKPIQTDDHRRRQNPQNETRLGGDEASVLNREFETLERTVIE